MSQMLHKGRFFLEVEISIRQLTDGNPVNETDLNAKHIGLLPQSMKMKFLLSWRLSSKEMIFEIMKYKQMKKLSLMNPYNLNIVHNE